MAAAQYVLSELYQLSSYLFSKQVMNQPDNIDSQGNVNFDDYLKQMDVEMGRF